MILFISKNNENDINYLIDKYIQTDSIPLKRKLYSKIKNHGIENIDENFNSSNSLRKKAAILDITKNISKEKAESIIDNCNWQQYSPEEVIEILSYVDNRKFSNKEKLKISISAYDRLFQIFPKSYMDANFELKE